MNITKSIKNIIKTMDAYAEPYTIQKTNEKTGKKERLLIIPVYGESSQYSPYI